MAARATDHTLPSLLGNGREGRDPSAISMGIADKLSIAHVYSVAGVERVRQLTGGFGVHSVLECVGGEQSMMTAIESLGWGECGALCTGAGKPGVWKATAAIA